MVFVQAYRTFDKKASISSFFIILTASFKSNRPMVANKQDTLDPFKEADNSSISLSLISFMIQLLVGVPRVTGTCDPKAV